MYGRIGIYTDSPLDVSLDQLALTRYGSEYAGKEERMERKNKRSRRRFDRAKRDRFKLRLLVRYALATYVVDTTGKKPRNFRVWGAGQGKAVRAGNKALKDGKSLKEALMIGLSAVLSEKNAKKYGNVAIRFYIGKSKKKETPKKVQEAKDATSAVRAAEGQDYETEAEVDEELDEAGMDEYEEMDSEEGLSGIMEDAQNWYNGLSGIHKILLIGVAGAAIVAGVRHYRK